MKLKLSTVSILLLPAAAAGGVYAESEGGSSNSNNLRGPSMSSSPLSFDENLDDYPQFRYLRKLQSGGGPPPIAPEIFVLIASIPILDQSLVKYETPMALRFTNYFGAMWWNCVAVYSTDYKDTLTKDYPVVRVPSDVQEHSSANRVACMAQTIATYTSLSLPEALPGFMDVITGNNPFGIDFTGIVQDTLDPSVTSCGVDIPCLTSVAANAGYSPTIIGQIVAKRLYDHSLVDGYNQLGTDDGCVVSCRPYRDITGYVPVNIPTQNQGPEFEERWAPLMEDNGKGFFYRQEHVTPHIGMRSKFRYLPESERTTRTAPPPGYTQDRLLESEKVLEEMAQLDDVKKIEVEIFDNKLIVGNAIFSSFVGKMISTLSTGGFVDPDFPTPPGLVLSLERFVSFAQGYLAVEYDATLIAWKEKVNYDLVRPTTVIKEWDRKITTWAPGGVRSFHSSYFEAYIRVMPHSEYVSGSSCLFQAAEDYIISYLKQMGLSTDFPVAFDPVAAGASKVEPGLVPAQEITLLYPTIEAMAAAGSQSRVNGGMHFEAAVVGGKILCTGIGEYAVTGTYKLFRAETSE